MTDRNLDFLHGTVGLLILRTIAREPLHGYGISRWLRVRIEDVLHLKDSALYQALGRLERRGRIDSEWRQSENHRRALVRELPADERRPLKRARWALLRCPDTLNPAQQPERPT